MKKSDETKIKEFKRQFSYLFNHKYQHLLKTKFSGKSAAEIHKKMEFLVYDEKKNDLNTTGQIVAKQKLKKSNKDLKIFKKKTVEKIKLLVLL